MPKLEILTHVRKLVLDSANIITDEFCIFSDRECLSSFDWIFVRPMLQRIFLGSPVLVVMGRDSSSKGCGFESWHHIQEGHFSLIFVVKIVMMFV